MQATFLQLCILSDSASLALPSPPPRRHGVILIRLSCFTFLFRQVWTQVHYTSPSPGVRENNGVVEYKGHLYLFGGYNGSSWLNDFHEFSLRSKVVRTPKPPRARRPGAPRALKGPGSGDIEPVCSRGMKAIEGREGKGANPVPFKQR